MPLVLDVFIDILFLMNHMCLSALFALLIYAFSFSSEMIKVLT